MENIEYNYEIVAVNQAERTMEVVYTSPGRRTQHISMRLPVEGEDLVAHIDSHAPIPYWRLLEASVIVPQVGFAGKVRPPTPQLDSALEPDLHPTIRLDPL